MTPYIYLELKETGDGRKVIRLLKNQFENYEVDGETYTFTDPLGTVAAVNVKKDKSHVHSYPVGTIFCVSSIYKDVGFYEVERDIDVCFVETSSGSKEDPVPVSSLSSANSAAYDYYEKIYKKHLKGIHRTVPKLVIEIKPSNVERIAKKFPRPKISEGFYVDDAQWSEIIYLTNHRQPTMFIGDAGTGKTSLVYKITQQFKQKLEAFDMGTMLDPISGLIGVHRIKKGQSVFDYSRFAQAIQKPRFILTDELNRATPQALNILFPCMDFRKELYTDMADSENARNIPVDEEVMFFATANMGHEYSGTNSLDKALKDRFQMVVLDFPPQEAEAELMVNKFKIDIEDAKMITKFVNHIRFKHKEGSVSFNLSVRGSMNIASRMAYGFTFSEAVMSVCKPLCYSGSWDTISLETLSTLLNDL